MSKRDLILVAILRNVSTVLVTLVYLGFGAFCFIWWLKHIITLKGAVGSGDINLALNVILFGVGLFLWFLAYWFIYVLIVLVQALVFKKYIPHENLSDIFPELKRGSKIFLVSGLINKKLSQVLNS